MTEQHRLTFGTLSFFVALVLSGCVTTNYSHENHPLAGKVFHTGQQRELNLSTYESVLKTADFLLLGETHDNPKHHHWQAEAVKALFDGSNAVERHVVFEHLHVGQGPTLTEFQKIPEPNAKLLGDLVQWEKSGWPPYETFEPIVAASLQQQAKIVAGNIPPEAIKAVYRNGMKVVLPEQTIARYKLDELPQSTKGELTQVIVDSHCGFIKSDQAGPMVDVQMSKDAFMALQLATVRGNGKAVLIAGRGHTRKDFGVPQYLAKLQPTSTVVAVGHIEVAEGKQTLADYPEARHYDVVVFTPAWQREDPCEKMRALMKKRRTARLPADPLSWTF